MGMFIEKTIEAINEKETASEKLLTLIEMHYNQLSESPHLAIVTQLELRQSKPELRKEINRVLKTYLNVIDSIIDQGIKENDIRNDVNPKIIRQMVFGTIEIGRASSRERGER